MLTRRARRFPNSLRSESKCSASIDELRSRVLRFASRCYTRCGSSPHVNLILHVHAPNFYFYFPRRYKNNSLSLYFCEIIFASRFSAMRLSSHRSHTSSRFESLIAQINFILYLVGDLFDLGYAALAPTGRPTSSRFDLSTILLCHFYGSASRGRRFA